MSPRMRLRVAIQKSGRLGEGSRALLRRCGLEFHDSADGLICFADNMPIDVLLVRDDDIPDLIESGICDVGIVGRNVLAEYALRRSARHAPRELRALDFGNCRLSLAAPGDIAWEDSRQIEGLRIATSYPHLLRGWLTRNGIDAKIVTLAGSVEIAPRLGTADLICELVSTGATLAANGLREISVVMNSTAVLAGAAAPAAGACDDLLNQLLRRLDGALRTPRLRLLMFKAPRNALARLVDLLPNSASPTVTSIEGQPDDVALQCLCHDQVSWQTLESMQQAGARSLLVLPVEKMLA